MSAITVPLDPLTSTIGRRPSGARLYHRGSQFGPPAIRKLDRNMRVRIFHLAVALDRRTRQPRQHGGILKRTGVEVLRVLLFTFLRVCIETVRKAIRALEAAGIVETVRRKVIVAFTSRVHRARYDVCVQDSNSYLFNVPLPDRQAESDLAMPLLRPRSQADARNRYETNQPIKNIVPLDLTALKEHWVRVLLGIDGTG